MPRFVSPLWSLSFANMQVRRNALQVFAAATPTLLAFASLASLGQAAGDQKLAIKTARVIPAPGAEAIEKGIIVIEGGKIVAVGGPDTKIPWDAPVMDA